MNGMLHRLHPLAVLLACHVALSWAAPSSMAAMRPGMGIAHPTNYVSASGEFTLFVDPADRFGHGAANYRLAKNGVEVWSGAKPYTLREVTVTDYGLAAGMAYRSSTRKEDDTNGSDSFMHIVILGSDGREILNDIKQRHHAPHTHGPTLPEVKQFIVDVANDRLIARVSARGSQWWIYRLSTGESVRRFDPNEQLEKTENLRYVIDARVLPGSTLMLVHWYVTSRDYEVKDHSGRFVLLDADYEPVWSFDAPDDYNGIDWYRPWGGGPSDYFRDHPAIVRADRSNRFDLRLFAENKQVSFAVSRDKVGQCEVKELGRTDFVESPPPERVVLQHADQPLPYLGELTLETERASAPPFRSIIDFTFGPDGHIYAWRRAGDDGNVLLKVDAETGAVLNERPFAHVESRFGLYWSDTARIQSRHFLVMRPDEDEPKNRCLWSVDLVSGTEERLDIPITPRGYAKGVSRSADGRLVVLESYTYQNSLQTMLACYGADGRELWRRDSRDEWPDGLLGQFANDVVFTSDGRIALLAGKNLHFLDAEGELLSELDLSEALGGYPGYIPGIVADAEGGCIVKVTGAADGIVRINADGTLRGRFSTRYQDGKTFHAQPNIRVDPAGRLWTSDGEAFLRLTEEGVVDHFLGEPAKADRIDRIAAFTADRHGRLYAAAKGSGAVHVFDRTGKLLHICQPAPSDFEATVTRTSLVVSDDGQVHLRRAQDYVQFSSKGERVGIVDFEPSLRSGMFTGSTWQFQPKTSHRIGIFRGEGLNEDLVIVDRQGTIVHRVSRRLGGKWLPFSPSVPAVASDGSMAMLVRDVGGKSLEFAVDIFDAQAEPLRTIPLPRPKEHYSAIAYDGERIVVAGNSEVLTLNRTGDDLRRWSLIEPGVAEGRWSAFIMPGGDELLLYDERGRKLHRYGLPSVKRLTKETVPGEPAPAETPPDLSEAKIHTEWVERYLTVFKTLPKPAPCVAYIQKIDRGEKTLTEVQAMALSREERSALRIINLDECGIRFDAPRMYARLLDIAALGGLEYLQGMRVLDFGCCDLRHLQSLARLGVETVSAQTDFSLTAMCNDWEDIGEIEGPTGQQGHLQFFRYGDIQPDTAAAVFGDGYDLITIRSVLHNPDPDDYFASAKWLQTGLGRDKESIASALYDLLRPGGYVLVYNIALEPTPTENALSRDVWEGAGFEIDAFDQNEAGAVLGIGAELGWDAETTSLVDDVRAMYTLARRPF